MTVQLNIPFHRQEHALSCEITALKRALMFKGKNISENELLKRLPFDTKEPRGSDNIWGDPDRGFVVNIDGKIPDQGYGVYEGPITDLAKLYRPSRIIDNATLTDILTELSRGNPVIIWGTLASGKDISWNIKDGKFVKAIYGEHTRVLAGFSGTIEKKIYCFLTLFTGG